MRRLAAILASVIVLSCGGSTPAPGPTAPSVSPPPTPAPRPAFPVSGTIRDDKGAPVAEAKVWAGCSGCKTGPSFSATTGAAGTYSGNLPAGTWTLIVTKPGFLTLRLYDLVVAGDTTRDVTIKPGVIIHGKTFEAGVGPLTGVLIEAVAGPSAGASTMTNPPGVAHAYGLTLLPGEHRIRASKPGYDPVERTVNALVEVSNIDFTLKWAYGSCLRSVSPILFEGYPSAGGEETITVDVNPNRTWTATPDQPWLEVASTSATPARVTFRVLPHPPGASEARTGAIMIRCSASEGQNVWVVQKPDCAITLTPHAGTPAEFPAAGGTGTLRVVTGPARCKWKAESRVDWIHTVGVSSWYTSFDSLTFVVAENRTGGPRTGTLVVGETVWTIRQR